MQVNKGLALDYIPADGSAEGSGYSRPLDRHLRPLEKKLALKMSLYAAPDRAEDKARPRRHLRPGTVHSPCSACCCCAVWTAPQHRTAWSLVLWGAGGGAAR